MKLLLVLLCAVGLVCGQGSVLDVAREQGATTVVDLIEQQGLGDALRGEGPFTLFAPVNEAFENVPPEVLDDLTNVLLGHVANVARTSFEFENEGKDDSLLTLGETTVQLRANIYQFGFVYTVSGSPISGYDNLAENGVVHLIDRVIYPYPTQDLVSYLSSQERFSTLVAAVVKAGIADALQADGLTILAPNNDAFEGINIDDLDAETLAAILLYHVSPGTVFSRGIANGSFFQMADGNFVLVTFDDDGTFVINAGEATIVQGDFIGTNGVIHELDSVLLPFKK